MKTIEVFSQYPKYVILGGVKTQGIVERAVSTLWRAMGCGVSCEGSDTGQVFGGALEAILVSFLKFW